MVRAEVRRFQRATEEVATDLKSQLASDVRVKILTHTDADGIAAGNILARCLNYYDIPFHITFTPPLSPSKLEELAKEDYDLFFFLDQGTGQISGIEEYLLNAGHKVVILDHHPGRFPDRSGLFHLNPHSHDLNGAKDVSASGVVYSVVKELNERFTPLSEIALIGALGDRQEFFSGFTGVNQEICKQSIDEEILKVKQGLKLVPRTSKISETLLRSIKPYLSSISGDEEAAQKLVENTGLDPNKVLAELDLESEEKLKDAILNQVKVEPTGDFKHALWGTIYTSTVEQTAGPKNAHEYVAMLDACEKLGRPELGFATLFGDEDARDEALEMLREYQEKMVKVLDWFASKRKNFKANPQMRYIDTGNEVESKMIGEALSLAIESSLINPDLPIFGLADFGEDGLKVSARATPDYAMRGPNIGNILGKVSRELGGSGGGHDTAAAARLPRERKDEFITKVSQSLEEAVAGNE
ncbi:hypothetical protein AKJ42_00265 [candidate division MSBL1 archaeon SCGC-AAA261C02]|uniref:Uncharacterized protein n=1 Tax=candidate division MSBL1 archaeon SCGC-AAA261C02 TaxID=1698272 RepID=A0A133V292_9EURY|nr:hypothetical protein AKJ42_00265 [candidate division MSBL1 archaeon SCGC-AAA261C02]